MLNLFSKSFKIVLSLEFVKLLPKEQYDIASKILVFPIPFSPKKILKFELNSKLEYLWHLIFSIFSDLTFKYSNFSLVK